MLVRAASPPDIAAVHRVRMSVNENRLTQTVITVADYLDAIGRTGRGWVTEIDGTVRGFAIANRENSSIWALFVEPGFENQGIGRALHDVMMDWMRTVGCEKAWLVTEPGTRAEGFYRRAGWQLTELTADGEARFEMALS